MKNKTITAEYKEKNGADIHIYSEFCIEEEEADKIKTEIKDLIRQ